MLKNQKNQPLKFNPDFSFKNNLSLKDFSVQAIVRHYPHVKDLLDEVLPLIEHKAFITVDYSELVLTKGQKTCKDTGWHVDGIGNQYLLVSFGDFRTKFLGKKSPAKNQEDLRLHNQRLSSLFSLEQGHEVENGVPVVYDSSDVHCGQKASFDGKRVFLRICSSDYLRPKNKVLEK